MLPNFIWLVVLLFYGSTLKAQPDPDSYNKRELFLLTERIGASDTINYSLHWRRAQLLGQMAGRFEQLEPLKKRELHNYFLDDIGLLIENQIQLEDFKAVTMAHYYFTRANYYVAIDERDKALEDYELAIEKDEGEPVSYTHLRAHET